MTAARSGKMPTTSVRRRISLLSRSSGLFYQIWRQCSLGKRGEGEQVGAGLVEQLGGGGEALLELVHDARVLLVDRVGVGLVEDRAHQRRHEALRALGDAGQQVAHEVRAAALPARARQRRGDRVDEPGVGVGGDQLHAGQAARDQAAQERQPGGAVLGGDDVQAEDSR